MFPPISFAPITIEIAGHRFDFRRLTWRDEMRFHAMHQKHERLSQLSFAMVSVDSRPLRMQDAHRLVQSLPRPVRERLVILYRGSLPSNRLPEADLPKAAPEPRVIQATINEETEDAEQTDEDFLERKFGRDEVRAATAQAQAIAQASNLQGAVKALPDDCITDEEEPPPQPYMTVI